MGFTFLRPKGIALKQPTGGAGGGRATCRAANHGHADNTA
jgi:hypothetical protein